MITARPRELMRWAHSAAHNRVAKMGIKTTRRLTVLLLSLARRNNWARQQLHLPANESVHPLQADTAAGIRTLCTGQPHTFRRSLPRLPLDSEALPFFAQRVREPSDPGFVSILDDGYVWGYRHGAVFTRDGRFVPSLTRDPWGAKLHSVWIRTHLPAPKRIPGRMLYLVTPEAATNFHHWMIDLLPRIGMVERAGISLAGFDHIVVNHCASSYQWETLERVGIPRSKVITIDENTCLRPDQLVIPSLKYSNEVAPAEDIRFLREKLLPTNVDPSARRRVFLTRRDALMRCLENEPEIEQLLRSYGFETIVPSRLSVTEQARVFAEAEMIVGSGAGLANLVFARPGTHVVELASPKWLTVYHWMISARMALNHTIILSDGDVHCEASPKIGDREGDFSINIRKLDSILSSLPEHPVLRHPVPHGERTAHVHLSAAPVPAAENVPVGQAPSAQPKESYPRSTLSATT